MMTRRQLVVAGGEGPEGTAAQKDAAAAGVLLIEARPVRPRGEPSLPNVFRLGVPEPAADRGADGGLAESPRRVRSPLAWHDSLDRFGAEQLNRRFFTRHGVGMDGAAWTAWLAVKVVVEAALRSGSSDAADVAGFLASERALFDGHKGRPLRFRRNHQLEHPLYEASPSGGVQPAEWSWDSLEEGACAGGLL